MQLIICGFFLEVREASPRLSAGIGLREAAGRGAPSACWTETTAERAKRGPVLLFGT
jgi:hypothetical protein